MPCPRRARLPEPISSAGSNSKSATMKLCGFPAARTSPDLRWNPSMESFAPLQNQTAINEGCMESVSQRRPLHPQVGIGHVHLKVADLDRALAFYRDVLGFELTQRYGKQAAFVSAGGYHHHIGLNTWESSGGSPPPPGTTGLYHLAILYPTRAALADALRRLNAAAIALEGASDHGVSEALYLSDPAGS